MHQLTFSDQSLAELDKLDKDQQLQFVSLISDVAMKEVASKRPTLPMFQRDGKIYYRIKIGTSRVYVEKTSSDSVFCHYILPQYTLSDFLFRTKFPVSEEQMVEQHASFWKYLESLKK